MVCRFSIVALQMHGKHQRAVQFCQSAPFLLMVGDNMKRKQIVDLFTAIFLILTGIVLLVLPLMNVMQIKKIVLIVFALYALLNIVQYALTYKDRDYEGLLTCIASLVTIIMALKIDIASKPWNLAIVLFVWVILMSLIKLKKTDYYNDRHSRVWILKMITLGLFIISGLLATINLYYTADIQILVLGFFFFIHGVLELLDPITIYLMNEKK